MRPLRLVALTALAAAFASAPAQQTLVKLSAFPTVSVADGRSTSAISAELRDNAGKVVPDGTRVVFNTTLGTFRESIVTTVNGIARAILVSDGRAGIARITATPLSGSASPANLEFEFVADRAMLSSAREYIELVAPGVMHYTSDNSVIGASGPRQGVSLRYRDIAIEADDLQVNIPTYELRARKARVRMAGVEREYDAIYLKLNQRRGFGITTYQARRPKFPVWVARGMAYAYQDDEGKLQLGQPPLEEKFGLVEINRNAVFAATVTPADSAFELTDLSFATSRVSAKKAVIFPNKQIQFHRAQLYVADTKVIQLPLFQVTMNGNSPLLTDSLLNVSDSNIALNYPHYLSLKPGQTSLLRFRTGDTYGRGVGTGNGAFMDYELNWNRGEEMDGGLAVRGIGRNDWSLGIRQFSRFDANTSGFIQLDFPAGRSIFGNGFLSREFDGFQVSLNATANQTLRGLRQSNRDLNLVAETNPIQLGRLPLQAYYGVTASTSERSFQDQPTQRQDSAGARIRLQSQPLRIDTNTTISTSFNATQNVGGSTVRGLQLVGNATLSHRFASNATMLLGYDFTRDGFNDQFLGTHRLSMQSYFQMGKVGLRLFHSRSLDIDRSNLLADLEFRPSNLWVFRTSYTSDRYSANQFTSSFLDMQYSFGYTVGWREIGLVYSRRTGRFGIQLLGAGGY
jgi:hypothetical protein